MWKQCRLEEVEEILEEMEEPEISDDVVELEEGYLMVLSGWHVRIPKLNLRIHEGVVEYWDEELNGYLPDFGVMVIYPEEPTAKEYLFFEQNGIVTTMVNWLHGQLSIDEIEQLRCEIVIPHESSM